MNNNKRFTSTNIQCNICKKFYYVNLNQTECPNCFLPTPFQFARQFNKATQGHNGLYMGQGLVVSPNLWCPTSNCIFG